MLRFDGFDAAQRAHCDNEPIPNFLGRGLGKLKPVNHLENYNFYCFSRTNDEKKLLKDENTKDQWKQDNLKKILSRMKGWQLETFEESYNHKKKNGISLFKKNILENK